jgi:hypothetical protein
MNKWNALKTRDGKAPIKTPFQRNNHNARKEWLGKRLVEDSRLPRPSASESDYVDRAKKRRILYEGMPIGGLQAPQRPAWLGRTGAFV